MEIALNDVGRQRTVSFDFESRAELERQLAAQLRRRGTYASSGLLLEFTNEAGETLAVLASAYRGHTIAAR